MQSSNVARTTLEIPEIVQEICSNFRMDGFVCTKAATPVWWEPIPISYSPNDIIEWRPLKRAALLRIAMTNRLFSNTALDALWFAMPSLVPLFRLVGLEKNNATGKWVLPQKFRVSQLARMLVYARRIRHLFCQAEPEIPHQLFLFARRIMRDSGLPFLPLLRTLDYPWTDYLTVLVSPNLHTVRIHPQKRGSPTPLQMLSWSSFMHLIDHDADSPIRCLEFPTILRQPSGIIVLPRLSYGLYSLSINNLSSKSLNTCDLLVILDALTVLHLSFIDEPVARFQPPHAQVSYPLRHLIITGNVETTYDIIQHLFETPLKSIEVKIHSTHEESTDSWDTWIPHIGSWSQSLTHLRVWDISREEREYVSSGIEMLQPLLQLNVLERLCIDSATVANPNDWEYNVMLASWPLIHSLRLNFSLHTLLAPHRDPCVNLNFLSSVATKWHSLNDLVICLHVYGGTTIPPVCSHRLQSLSIFASITASEGVDLVRHVDRLFPELTSLTRAVGSTVDKELNALTGGDEDLSDEWDESETTWTVVPDILKLCQDSRMGRTRV